MCEQIHNTDDDYEIMFGCIHCGLYGKGIWVKKEKPFLKVQYIIQPIYPIPSVCDNCTKCSVVWKGENPRKGFLMLENLPVAKVKSDTKI